MYRIPLIAAAVATSLALPGDSRAAVPQPRVCADPDDLPFSNRRGEGFENRIAEIVADQLGVTLDYTWWPQRRGFLQNTLRAGRCDVIVGIADGLEMVRRRSPVPLALETVAEAEDGGVPMRFDLSMGVRDDDDALARELDEAVARRRREIDAVLDRHGVPRLDSRAAPPAARAGGPP
jgi:hypothetical protein